MAEYDYIIIGAGSAGGFLAYRLSEYPGCRVLLLEAGPSDRHWTTRIPAGNRFTFGGGPRTWSFSTEPEPGMNGRRLDQPRGRCLGGSSSLNGMVYVRGHPADYDQWTAAGVEGWTWNDVLPWFRSMETARRGGGTRGGAGPITVLTYSGNHPIEEAFLEAGVEAGWARPDDYNNGIAQEGVCAFDANIRDGVRSGTGRECVEPAARRPNVTVLTGARAARIVIEDGRATGVTYRCRGRDRTDRASAEVLCAAGAFQSPQLLMLSGVGPGSHLRKFGIDVAADLPGVGRNLQDHLECHIKFQSPIRGVGKNKLLSKHRMLMAGIRWCATRGGPAASGPSRVGGFFRSGIDAGYPDIQFHFWPYYLEGWSPPPDKDGYVFDVGPVRSESRGEVTLASDNPFAAPRIVLNGLTDPADFRRFRRALEIARDIESRSPFDFCRGSETTPGADAISEKDIESYVRRNANSAYHPCGTCRMGSDGLAVTDAEARVHGIAGLRVVDASIMPIITNGNINAPAMMIGERVAHMIMGRAAPKSDSVPNRKAAPAGAPL